MAFSAPILSFTKRSTTAELPAITSYCTRDLLPSLAVPSQMPARLCSLANADCASAGALRERHGSNTRDAAKIRALDHRFVSLLFPPVGRSFRICFLWISLFMSKTSERPPFRHNSGEKEADDLTLYFYVIYREWEGFKSFEVLLL